MLKQNKSSDALHLKLKNKVITGRKLLADRIQASNDLEQVVMS